MFLSGDATKTYRLSHNKRPVYAPIPGLTLSSSASAPFLQSSDPVQPAFHSKPSMSQSQVFPSLPSQSSIYTQPMTASSPSSFYPKTTPYGIGQPSQTSVPSASSYFTPPPPSITSTVESGQLPVQMPVQPPPVPVQPSPVPAQAPPPSSQYATGQASQYNQKSAQPSPVTKPPSLDQSPAPSQPSVQPSPVTNPPSIDQSPAPSQPPVQPSPVTNPPSIDQSPAFIQPPVQPSPGSGQPLPYPAEGSETQSLFAPISKENPISTSTVFSPIAVHPSGSLPSDLCPAGDKLPSPQVVPPAFNHLAHVGRTGIAYRPPYHHWFYKKEMESKDIWYPFSMTDSVFLEQTYQSGNNILIRLHETHMSNLIHCYFR